MSLLRPRVRDGRGARVRLLSPLGGASGAMQRAAAPLPVNVALAIGTFLAAGAFATFITELMVLCLDVVGVLEAWDQTYEWMLVLPLVLLWGWLFLLAAGRLLHMYWRRRGPIGARRLGVCAACGYDLKTTASEADGCTVCPECGAAWRMEGTGEK